MKKAVMYGAGNIGRGFIGQVLHDSGYRVVFIDIHAAIVDALNNNGCYTQLIVSGDTTTERIIDNVCAVNAGDVESVQREIADCDLMAVSVGVSVLPRVAPVIAGGIAERMKRHPGLPLNILICENIVRSHHALRNLLCEVPGFDAGSLKHVGLVRTTLGRMVPVLSGGILKDDPAKIAVEPFCELPADKDAFVGKIPDIAHVMPYSPFAFYEDKKLLIHNMGHAITAYFGNLKGHTFIWQAVEDPGIFSLVKSAMLCVAKALEKEYGACKAALSAHVDDLIFRFGNKGLGDTVERVAREPMRKLGPDDRFTGAVNKCKGNGVSYDPILTGIAAALCYQNNCDPSAAQMREQIQEHGPAAFLKGWCRLSEEDSQKCEATYERLCAGADLG